MSTKVPKTKKQKKTVYIHLDESIIKDIKIKRYHLFSKINDFYGLMNTKSPDTNLDFKLGCWVNDFKKSLNEFESLISKHVLNEIEYNNEFYEDVQ